MSTIWTYCSVLTDVHFDSVALHCQRYKHRHTAGRTGEGGILRSPGDSSGQGLLHFQQPFTGQHGSEGKVLCTVPAVLKTWISLKLVPLICFVSTSDYKLIHFEILFWTQAEEFKKEVTEEYLPWAAQYLVMKRASIEPNFHTLYANFVDALNLSKLATMVTKETFRNIRVSARCLMVEKITAGLSSPMFAYLHSLAWVGMCLSEVD